MTKLKKRVLKLLFTVLVLLCSFVLGGLFQNTLSINHVPTITSELIANELIHISEYASLEYRYTNVGKFEDRLDFNGWNIPFTTKSFIITYEGSMKLGIKGSDVKVELVNDEIRMKLPSIEILSHEIYENTIEVFDQTKNIFNQIQVKDYTSFAAEQKTNMEQKAEEDGLFTEASTRTKQQLEAFLTTMLANQKKEYKIIFID